MLSQFQPREDKPTDVGPSAMFVGSIVQGARLAAAEGRDFTSFNEEDQAKRHQFLSEVLRWRANTMPDHELFTYVSSKVRFSTSLPLPASQKLLLLTPDLRKCQSV